MELELEESAAVGDENNDEGEEDDNSELTHTLFGKGSVQ